MEQPVLGSFWAICAPVTGLRSDGGGGPRSCTMVVCETTLSAGVSSISAEVTDARLIFVPVVVAVAVNVIVTVWPGTSVAKLHSTCVRAEHMPGRRRRVRDRDARRAGSR